MIEYGIVLSIVWYAVFHQLCKLGSTSSTNYIVFTKNILRILVGLDGSELSFEAADYAVSLAKHYRSELFALHVIPSKSLVGHSSGIFGVVTPAFSKKVTEEAEKWFAVIKEKLINWVSL